MSMKEPVDHIIRVQLPWRDGTAAITECGYNASSVKSITRQQFTDRVKELGQQRAAMFTCMTCAQTVRSYECWDADPRSAMGREVEWEYGGGWRRRSDRGHQLKDELVVIAALIESHRDEFDAAVNEQKQRREWLEKKNDLQKRESQKHRQKRL